MNEASDIARAARQREQATLREPGTTRETFAALREIVGPGEARHEAPFPAHEQRTGFRPAPAAGPTPAAAAAYADSGLRMRDLFSTLRRRARLVGAVAIAGALVAGTLSALLPPSYVATAQVMVEPAASEVAAGLLAPVVDTHIILLTSEARLRRVFDDLAAEPRYIEASAAVRADPSFAERAKFLLRDAARELGFASRPVEPEAETPSTDLGPAQARAAMLVRQERQSSIISVTFQDRSAQRAALVANRMVTRHVQELGERRTQEAVGRKDFQEQRVEEARAEVEEAERLVRAFQVENGASVTDREGESVAEMTQQLVLLRSEIASRERDAGKPADADEIRVIRLQADALEARLAELKAVQGTTVDRRIERQALDLRLDTARKNLTDQLRQLEESSKPQPAFASAARVVAQASAPTRPNTLHPVVVAVPALVAFGILGAMVALLLERLATGYRSEREVEEELGVPCLGLVPRAPVVRASGASADLARSPWGRAVGALALTLLHRCGRPGSPCVVLVTSCAREQDKAGLATALAVHAHQNGLRVLLVRWDDDAALGQGFSYPLSDGGIASKSFSAAAFVRDPALGVDRPVSERVERDLVLGLGGDRSVRVRHVLAYEYDLVVMDAPPMLASAQARVIAQDADAALLALAWARTDRRVAEQALRLLRRPMPLAGDESAPDEHAILAVLTDVNLKAHARYRLGDVGEHLFEAQRRWDRSRRTARRSSAPTQKQADSASDKRPDIEPGAPPVPRRRAGA